jgi:hypothetical protein
MITTRLLFLMKMTYMKKLEPEKAQQIIEQLQKEYPEK